MVRLLTDTDLAELLDLPDLFGVVKDAFVMDDRGAIERPTRPHFPVGLGMNRNSTHDPEGTGLVMPAYIHGSPVYATKLVSVHPDNSTRGLPTVNAQIALTDAVTGQPAAYMAGTRITNARTACIGGLAAQELAVAPATLGVIGAGTQARWQARAIASTIDIDEIRVYSPSDSKHKYATSLHTELGIPTQTTDSPTETIQGANIVVTATTATEPVFPGHALNKGTLVIAIGAYTHEMRELDETTINRAALIFADVPEEVAEIGDIAMTTIQGSDLIPFSRLFTGRHPGRTDDGQIIIVESVGSAILDAATATQLYEKARTESKGVSIAL